MTLTKLTPEERRLVIAIARDEVRRMTVDSLGLEAMLNYIIDRAIERAMVKRRAK